SVDSLASGSRLGVRPWQLLIQILRKVTEQDGALVLALLEPGLCLLQRLAGLFQPLGQSADAAILLGRRQRLAEATADDPAGGGLGVAPAGAVGEAEVDRQRAAGEQVGGHGI